jgi:hypothetical protein
MSVRALYVDGGVIAANPSPYGGTWAWCHVDEERHTQGTIIRTGSGIVLPHPPYDAITNNYAEMLAMVEGLESLPDGWGGPIYSDSDVTLGRVFRGNATAGLPAAFMSRVAMALSRLDLSTLTYHLVRGHPNQEELYYGWDSKGRIVSRHNVWCDKECKELARSYLASYK